MIIIASKKSFVLLLCSQTYSTLPSLPVSVSGRHTHVHNSRERLQVTDKFQLPHVLIPRTLKRN